MRVLASRRVMVVEDEYYIAIDAARVLVASGADVIGPYPRTEDALTALARGRPDCAVLDINLGRGSEFALAERLRQQRIPFLFFTGYDGDVIPARFADVTRLEKPVNPAHLVRAVEALCTTS